MTLVRNILCEVEYIPVLVCKISNWFRTFLSILVAGETGMHHQSRRRCASSEDDLRTEEGHCAIAALAPGRALSSIRGFPCYSERSSLDWIHQDCLDE